MITELLQLRNTARAIFEETLRAIDPATAMRAAVTLTDSRLTVFDRTVDLTNRTVYAICLGKAGLKMAAAIEEVLGDKLTAGVISGTASGFAQTLLTKRWRKFTGGHPQPNEQSLTAAEAAFQILARADSEKAFVVFLVSGGGSAMMESPASDAISLADLIEANRILVNCGASIAEINSVRRAFSAVKGGKLAAAALGCQQISLIVSDVPEGEEWNVASGPSIAPPNGAPAAADVVRKFDLATKLPSSVLDSVEAAGHHALTKTAGEHFTLLNNESALQAAAKAAESRDLVTNIASDIGDEPIESGCKLLVERVRQLRRPNQLTTLISGGEFACPVRGNGIGGRNLETALRLALSPEFNSSEAIVALCAGTDGIDGNSPAAGALVDNSTLSRSRAIGLDAEDFLRRSDAYSFFVALGDVIATGPTGTNVRDLRIMIS